VPLSWLALLVGCEPPPDPVLLATALAAAEPLEALTTCERIGATTIADECRASVVRQRNDLSDQQAGQACRATLDRRWAGECWFTLAERWGAAGDRQSALGACGRAESYYNECLYHLWTGELSRAAALAPDIDGALVAGREIVAFWSGIQTIGPTPEAQLWADFWYFAHLQHRPADVAVCERVPVEERDSCLAGSRSFVRRAVLGGVLTPGGPPDLLDRICRTGQIPAIYTDGLVAAGSPLQAELDQLPDQLCAAAGGANIPRGNPVFSRRQPPVETLLPGSPEPGQPPPGQPDGGPASTPALAPG
jgi:hypothetical protein